ncbi:energy transducer TonB [Puia dinghuensis]|uniref:TonB C-terminal domain-containing protein n=1 Tax=Puia dinghuensis TaxID=1792502 RepID=A0A8J2UEC8_9BACT|nr:energy transducer TonB [Puia dinghuensis]GGB06024.1 hypothetical protein GCM10011511_31790 [Puia dinghuensis]
MLLTKTSRVTAISGLLLLFMSLSSRAQIYRNEKLTFLDGSGNPTKEKKAVTFRQVVKMDDTLWEINLYQKGGPRIRSMQSGDPDGHMLNGRYITYTFLGDADTVGTYSKGRREGYWRVFTRDGRIVRVMWYKEGTLLWTKDSVEWKQQLQLYEAFVPMKGEVGPEFPGGPAAWLAYLHKNLRYPDMAFKNRVEGDVIIAFLVDEDGMVSLDDVWVARSVEYDLDGEALRIIYRSPDWEPAKMDGKPVRSYREQPILFKLH